MKIKMLKEKFVLADGQHLERWLKGFEYSARDSVGSRLVSQGDAELVNNNDGEIICTKK